MELHPSQVTMEEEVNQVTMGVKEGPSGQNQSQSHCQTSTLVRSSERSRTSSARWWTSRRSCSPQVVMLVMMVVMLVMMVVNIKKILLSPVLGIGRQIVDTKLSLILPLLAPIIGLKRTGLGFLRGLIDQKIALLDNISSSVGGGGGGGYGAPPQSYGAPRGWRQRRNFLRRWPRSLIRLKLLFIYLFHSLPRTKAFTHRKGEFQNTPPHCRSVTKLAVGCPVIMIGMLMKRNFALFRQCHVQIVIYIAIQDSRLSYK